MPPWVVVYGISRNALVCGLRNQLRRVGTYVRAWSLLENFEANVDGREWTQVGDKTSLEVCEARANSPLRRVGFFKPGDEVTVQAAKQAAFAPHDLVS